MTDIACRSGSGCASCSASSSAVNESFAIIPPAVVLTASPTPRYPLRPDGKPQYVLRAARGWRSAVEQAAQRVGNAARAAHGAQLGADLRSQLLGLGAVPLRREDQQLVERRCGRDDVTVD